MITINCCSLFLNVPEKSYLYNSHLIGTEIHFSRFSPNISQTFAYVIDVNNLVSTTIAKNNKLRLFAAWWNKKTAYFAMSSCFGLKSLALMVSTPIVFNCIDDFASLKLNETKKKLETFIYLRVIIILKQIKNTMKTI